AFKSSDRASVLRLKPWPFSFDRRPSVFRFGSHSVHEFPAAVTPGLRLPIYHTLRYSLTDARFASALDGFVTRGEPFSYCLHAVDVLGLEEDAVDRRLAKHPGMDWPLARKLELLEKSLRSLVERFAIATFGSGCPSRSRRPPPRRKRGDGAGPPRYGDDFRAAGVWWGGTHPGHRSARRIR